MKRWWLAGAALLLLAIVVQFPAAWLAPAVVAATDGQWRLARMEGTIWHGRATLYAFDRTTGYWHSGPAVRWRALWRKIFSGVLAARLELDQDGRAELAARVNGWSLEGVDATFPAGQLAVLLPSTVGDYGWGGTLAVRTSAFRCSWGRPLCTGQMELTWQGAALPQLAGQLLGDYGLRVTAEADALRFTVRTLRGRLQAAGAGEISGGRLQFTGEAYATGDDVRLESMLRAIGRPGSAPGRYLIEYRERSSVR
jgi:general secretion pathway protein N